MKGRTLKRRKVENTIKKAVVVGMGVLACLSAVLHAFHKPLPIYAFLFVISFGWVVLFTMVNSHD